MDQKEKEVNWPVAFRVFIFLSINLLILAAAFYYWRIGLVVAEPELVLNPAHVPFYNPEMPVRLSYYALATFFVGIALLLALLFSLHTKNSRFCRYVFWRNFIVLGLGLLLSFVIPSVWVAVFPLVMFFGLLFAPRWVGLVPAGRVDGPLELRAKKFFLSAKQLVDRYAISSGAHEAFCLGCFERFPWLNNFSRYFNVHFIGVVVWLCGCLCLALFSGPKIWETHKLLNPYYRVPNTYHYYSSLGKIRIDPTELINGTNMYGAHGKIDVTNIETWKDNPLCVEVAPDNPELQNYVNAVNAASYPERGSFFETMSRKDRVFLFYGEGRLCVIPAENISQNRHEGEHYASLLHKLEALTGKDFSGVAATLNMSSYSGPLDFASLQKLDVVTRQAAESYRMQTFFETAWQIMFLGDLRHQAYYVLPIHEYLNGKPLDKIHHFYGVGYTILGGILTKIIAEDGQINWGKTVRCIGASVLLTLLTLSFTVWKIFKDFRVVSVCILIYLLKNIALGGEIYAMNFGQIDLRIIFYFPTLYFFYLYTQKPNVKHAASLLALSGISVCFFFEFGVGTLLACSAAVLVMCILDKRFYRTDVFVLLVQLQLLILGYYVSQIGTKEVAGYFIKGMMAGILECYEVFSLVAIFAGYMILFFYMRLNSSKYSILFLYTVFYSQIIAVYYIWHASPDHYTGYAHIHTLPVVIFCYFFFVEKKKIKFLQNIVYIAAVLLLSMGCINQYSYFTAKLHQYKACFYLQDTYRWKKMNTNFYSTMDMQYFENAVALIDEYLPQDKKDIFLLSQYDQFLLFLSKKYTNMPVYDIYGYLLTPKENEKVVNLLKGSRPEYLFVDSDITSPYLFDIVPHDLYGDFYHKMSLFRALALTEISAVFHAVKDEYEMVEHGELLSVYKRKETVMP